jgi:nucleotide-binding universal stress UspA family protein
MFRNILVSVDGSPHADRALNEAIDLASLSGARLTILTGIRRPSSWAYSPATVATCASLEADFEREAKQVLTDAVGRVPETVPVTTVLTHEPIREALLHRVDAGHHDLLVMGSRGRGALSASLLGSVSHYALNHCPIPVLIMHATEDAPPPAQAEREQTLAEPAPAPRAPAQTERERTLAR